MREKIVYHEKIQGVVDMAPILKTINIALRHIINSIWIISMSIAFFILIYFGKNMVKKPDVYILVIFPGVLLFLGARSLKHFMDRKKVIDLLASTEMNRVQGFGIVKIEGKICADRQIKAPYSGKECIWHQSQTQVFRSRTGWRAVERIISDSGNCRLISNGKSYGLELKFSTPGFIYGEKILESGDYGKKMSESILSQNSNVFVLGLLTDNAGKLAIVRPPDNELIVSARPEAEILARLKESEYQLTAGAMSIMLSAGLLIFLFF
ncbi:MAG: GIDE domain-containing protein [Candidatus Micrarchaeota archaeon]